LVRALNEDTLLTLEIKLGISPTGISFGLYAVADGVGGHEAGEIASGLALRILAESVVKSLLLPGLRAKACSSNKGLILETLTEGVEAANNEVYVQAQAKGNNMGTTLVAALFVNNTVYIANVGDSRIYLLEGEQLRQVTNDHSLVASLVAAGEITPEEIYTHPRRNVITRCLGMGEHVDAELFTETLKPGNSLLLCSDGLWEMVRDNEIRDIVLSAQNPQPVCEQLVELANRNGGVDNISVIVVKIN
jgi:protein phosphatase